MAAPVESSTRWITFVYQGTRTVSYIFTPPAGAAATAAVDATSAVGAAVAAGSITPTLAAGQTETVLPVSVGTTVVIATLSSAPVAAAVTSPFTLATGNAYESARSAASAAEASASAAGLGAAPEDGSSSNGGASGGSSLSQGATIGIGVGAGVGGLVLLLGLIACCLCMRRRSKRKEDSKYYVHTAEEQEKLASARNSARNSSNSSPRTGVASPAFATVREPVLPKVSEERFADGRTAAPVPPQHALGYMPNNAPSFMGANPPSAGHSNGPRTSSLSAAPGSATRPGSGPPILPTVLVPGGGFDDRNRRSTTPRDASPLGPRGNAASSRERLPGNDYSAGSPARYHAGASTIPVSSGAEAARYVESSGNGRPPRMGANESPRRSANQSPSGYHQQQMQQQTRLLAPAQNSYSGFDFGTGTQGRGPSPDFRAGNQGRGPSPDPRSTSDHYGVPRGNIGNY